MDSRPDETKCPVPSLDAETELKLLTELRPWHEVFTENLADFILQRRPPRYYGHTRTADFWPDVFVPTGIPWPRMRLSALGHIFVVLAIYGLTKAWVLDQRHHPEVRLHPVVHYDLSEYLPPMDTGSPPAPKPQVGKPLLAKQKVISLQPNADNHEQTIISPVDVKLPQNIQLPNIVAWTAIPGAPMSAAVRSPSQMKLPDVPSNVVAPAPDLAKRDLSQMRIADATPNVIEPAPDAHGINSSRKLDVVSNVVEPSPSADLAKLKQRTIAAPAPSIIEPPPSANVARNLGEMNIGHLAPTVAAPRIQVAEQRTLPQPGTGAGAKGGGGPATSASPAGGAPPINPVGGISPGQDSGQLIALNLHPAIPNGPISVPPGRRSGEFAAGPEGTAGAPGTPDIKAGGNGPGGSGTGTAGAGKGKSDLPPGITIGNAPGAPPPGSVVVAGTPAKNSNADKQVLVASTTPPRVGDISRDTRPNSNIDTPKIADRVFGAKRSYSMSLNMPNLTSSGGSWIIRFAQLEDDKTEGSLSAPIAMTKVDPAYPAELARDGVEGTVVLYAVIHKDGTVGDVRVLRGVQGRLDESARMALARWKFRPGTKNGTAVDLEAVVQIPFRAPRLPF